LVDFYPLFFKKNQLFLLMMGVLRPYFDVIQNYFILLKQFLFKTHPTAPEQFPIKFWIFLAGLLFLILLVLRFSPASLKKSFLNFLLTLTFGFGFYVFLWWEMIPYLTMPLLWLPLIFYLLVKFFLILVAIFAFFKEREEKDESKIQKLAEYF